MSKIKVDKWHDIRETIEIPGFIHDLMCVEVPDNYSRNNSNFERYDLKNL